ncbi:MAG TPA: AI-2E family transporter [Hyphomicrobiaceae bacterium]
MGLVMLLLLTVGCFTVLWPFLAAILWAGILAFSTWPIYRRVEHLAGERRGLAATLMTLGIAFILVVPLAILGSQISDDVIRLAESARTTLQTGPRPPPDWVYNIPLVGHRLAEFWQSVAYDGAALAAAARPYVGPARNWLLAQSTVLAGGILEVSLSVFTAFFLYQSGPVVVGALDAILGRIAGTRGHTLLLLAGGTVKGVVYGVLGTALAQAILATLGFWVAGVPGALFLGLLSFFLTLVPMGLVLVWVPAVIWLFIQDAALWGILLAIWMVFVSGIENVLRPYLISKGGELPFLLILLGILGGIIAFGLIGIFLGPTLLALGYSLISEWARNDPSASTSETRGLDD